MPDVVIYTKSWCRYCTRAKGLLTRKGVPFQEVEISDDPARRDEMVERAGGRTTVPQIFVGEAHVGGCEDPYAREAAGRLDALLEEAELRRFPRRERRRVVALDDAIGGRSGRRLAAAGGAAA